MKWLSREEARGGQTEAAVSRFDLLLLPIESWPLLVCKGVSATLWIKSTIVVGASCQNFLEPLAVDTFMEEYRYIISTVCIQARVVGSL